MIALAGFTVDLRTASARLIPSSIIFEMQFGMSGCGMKMLPLCRSVLMVSG